MRIVLPSRWIRPDALSLACESRPMTQRSRVRNPTADRTPAMNWRRIRLGVNPGRRSRYMCLTSPCTHSIMSRGARRIAGRAASLFHPRGGY